MIFFRRRLRIVTIVALPTVVATLLAVPPALAAVPTAAVTVSPDALTPSVSRTYCGNNIWAVTIKPARGFNPLTATATQLESNGYPARPSSANGRAFVQWRSIATTHAGTIGSCDLRQVPATAARARPASPASLVGTQTRDNWAGYTVTGGVFTEAEATWDYTPATPESVANATSATWVGLGDGSSSAHPLIQAGTEADDDPPNDYIWFEVVPEQPGIQEITDDIPDPNDVISVHISEYQDWHPTGCNNRSCTNSSAQCTATTCALIHITDTALHKDFNKEYEVGGSWAGSTIAEWVYERVKVGHPTALANSAGPLIFQGVEAIEDNGADQWQTLSGLESNYTVTPLDMVDCVNGKDTSTKLAQAYGLSGSQFDVKWDASGHANQSGC
jgi:Peptidase A4 family